MLRTLTGDHLEVLMEAGEIIEAALEAELLNADPVIDQQLAGMPHTYFCNELREGLARPGFKIAAEGVGDETRHSGYFFQVDLFREIAEGIIVNGIDPVVLRFGKIMTEADGRK